MAWVVTGILPGNNPPPDPKITSWARLDIFPTSGDLAPALAAAIADPAWMLARQWQFGELTGEDAGSPIEVRLSAERSAIRRFRPGALGKDGTGTVDFDPLARPLETMVEAEDPAMAGPHAALMTGRQLRRMLTLAGLDGSLADAAPYRYLPLEQPDPALDPAGAGWAALAGNALDGHKLARAIAAAAGAVPPGFTDAPGLLPLLADWLAWYRGGLGALPASSWIANRLEYGFAAATGAGAGEAVLRSDQYVDGRLDWYDFDLAGSPSLDGAVQVETVKLNPLLPTPLRFGGMPADRFWEFEDARVNLSQVKAGPVDLGRMLLLEFALAFGNDWFVLPIELAVGALFRIRDFTVRDVFGEPVQLARIADPAGANWRMFELTGAVGSAADTFLLAPVIDHAHEGDPIEEVGLFRDEMANMAWAVERKVPGAMGLPIDRYREASLRAANTRLADLTGVTAELIYRLATSVPEHWLPLVPINRDPTNVAAADIVLERRAMLRWGSAAGPQKVQPRGVLLRTDLAKPVDDELPLRLEDEEVPREGAVLTRSAQFTRWVGGERLHWIGRRKRVGGGEGASGLRYDVRFRKGELTKT